MKGNSREDRPICAVLYRPTMDYFPPSIIGYFVISDGWSEQTLLALKEKSGADFLVGIQTGNNEFQHLFENLDTIKGIVKCQPDQVKDVIKLLDVYSPRCVISLNVYDIKGLFESSNSFKFVQTIATGSSESDLLETAMQQLVSQLSSVGDIRGLFVNPESSKSLALKDFAYISEAIESIYDGTEVYYSQSITNELNSFCVRAIYAEG
ncbi:hypothetical protein [Psychrobacter immobilis]|uniref:hypothetical protein n=1 Tax=Psychrobacter immobilis TaxID=498 RepID=UPI001919021D|nr:hypothetical protein [Psychrobacter immobilis]